MRANATTAREAISFVDKYYRAFQFSNGLVFAVRHDNHEMTEWLCRVHYPTMGFATKAVGEAVKLDNLRVVERLIKHREDIMWSPTMADDAVSRGHHEVLKWLRSKPKSHGCLRDGRTIDCALKCSAVSVSEQLRPL